MEAYRLRDPSALLAHAATQCIGIVEEASRPNRGRFVELFQRTIGPASGEPWCMSFVQSLVAFVEEICGPSLLPATEGCLEALRLAPESIRTESPRQGDLIIWRHGKGPQGHVGVILKVEPTIFKTVEGNTGTGEGIVREGDGVYARTRSKDPPGTMKIGGFLSPFSYASKPLIP